MAGRYCAFTPMVHHKRPLFSLNDCVKKMNGASGFGKGRKLKTAKTPIVLPTETSKVCCRKKDNNDELSMGKGAPNPHHYELVEI